MPNAIVKSAAKKSHRSVKRIEHYWDEAKKWATKKGLEKGTDAFWSYVNAIVQRRSGLREELTLREFMTLIEGVDDKHHGVELKKTGFYGKAGAGIIVVAQDTKNILMPYRSKDVEQPHTWGTWGGAIDVNEDPKIAARREFREEGGYSGKMEMSHLYTFKHPSGFRYDTFLGIIPKEFKPTLDWETEKVQWSSLKKLPQPLHFGLRAVLEDPAAMKKLRAFTGV